MEDTEKENLKEETLEDQYVIYYKAEEGSVRKASAGRELSRTIVHRKHLDESVKRIGEMLFGWENGAKKLAAVRPAGSVVVDDWACLKAMVRTFEAHCGPLTQYAMKHMRAFANICNAGVDTTKMSASSAKACMSSPTAGLGLWSPVTSKFSA